MEGWIEGWMKTKRQEGKERGEQSGLECQTKESKLFLGDSGGHYRFLSKGMTGGKYCWRYSQMVALGSTWLHVPSW